MTAPNVAAPVAPAPETQSVPANPVQPATVETSKATGHDTTSVMESMIGRVARRTNRPINPSPAESAVQEMTPVLTHATPASEPAADGQAAPASNAPSASTPSAAGAPAVDGGAPAVETPPTLTQTITADEPDGQVVLRARDPVTGQFSDMDQTRTYELSIRDKTTGETKVYEKDLPGLMRLAKDGITMQKSRDRLAQLEQAVPQFQQKEQQYQQQNQQLEALALQLLTADEPTVVSLREQYAQEQSPEKKLARLEAQMAEQRLQQLQAQEAQVSGQQAQQLAAQVAPIIQEVEGLVGKAAAAGQLALATAPLLVNGRIPPERFEAVARYMAGPYREWAKAEAATRQQAQTSATTAQQQARVAQQRAQQAVQQTGQAIRPVGHAGRDNGPPKPPARNVQDVINRIVSRPVQQGA